MNHLNFTLLNDQLSRSDAKDLLMGLTEKKMNYYRLKNLQSLVHEECCDPKSLEHLTYLNDKRKQLEALIEMANKSNGRIKINASISVQITEE